MQNNDTYEINPGFHVFDYRNVKYGFLSSHGWPFCYVRLDGAAQRILSCLAEGSRDCLSRVSEGEALLSMLTYSGILLRPTDTGKTDKSAESVSGQDVNPCDLPGPAHEALWLFPTNRCNLRCVYCYAAAGEKAGDDISPETVNAGMSWFFKRLPASVKKVSLWFHGGGEVTMAMPVMREAWSRFKEMAKQKGGLGFFTGLSTNGCIGKEALDWLIAEHAMVQVSMDGPPEIQDRQRPFADGRGSFNKVSETVKRLVDSGSCKVSLRSVLTKEGVGALGEFVSIASAFGVEMLNVEAMSQAGRGKAGDVEPPDTDAFVREFMSAFDKGLRDQFRVWTSGLRCYGPFRDRFCMATHPAFAVTPEGFISSCPEVDLSCDGFSEYFLYGRVNNDGTVSIDDKKRERLRSRTVDAMDACRECFLKELCAGGCPVRGLRGSGSLFEPDSSYCEAAVLMSRELISGLADGKYLARSHFRPEYMFWRGTTTDGEAAVTITALTPPGHFRKLKPDERYAPLVPAPAFKPGNPDFVVI